MFIHKAREFFCWILFFSYLHILHFKQSSSYFQFIQINLITPKILNRIHWLQKHKTGQHCQKQPFQSMKLHTMAVKTNQQKTDMTIYVKLIQYYIRMLYCGFLPSIMLWLRIPSPSFITQVVIGVGLRLSEEISSFTTLGGWFSSGWGVTFIAPQAKKWQGQNKQGGKSTYTKI